MSSITDLAAACPSLQVLTEGYALGANNQGYRGSMRFWIAGSDLSQFLITVGGVAKTLTIGGNSVSRLIPLIHPFLDPDANCYSNDLNAYPAPDCIATVDGTGDGISFSDYFIDVSFATPLYFYEIGDYPCCRIDLDCGEDQVGRPGSAYIFPSDGKRLNRDVSVSVKTIDYTLTMYRLGSIDTALYQSLIGTVNLASFYGIDGGFNLYKGPVSQGQEVVAGVPLFTVGHKFQYRSIPHNAIMRPDGIGFEAPIEDNAGSPDTPDSTNEEDTANPIYLIPEGEHNLLWGM